MGYESRVFVVDVHRRTNFIYAEKVASMNLCKMGSNNGWLELFSKEIDYTLFMDDGNTEFDTDRYGDHMKSCSIEKVIAWLENEMQHNSYRRLSILYGLLKGFKQDEWENLEVVHYGY